jgi:hypothetical protein
MTWKFPVLILVLLIVGVVSYHWLADSTAPLNFALMLKRDKAPSRGAERMTDARDVPPDVLALRQRHHLRPLIEREDGNPVRALPNGIYGFGTCGAENLSPTRPTTSSLEIHKHLDGIVYYVGYASGEQIEKYLARQKNFHIFAFPRPTGHASLLFEIPVAFVSQCALRSSRDGSLFDLFVTAIPELHT